jgi:hypothetical protein
VISSRKSSFDRSRSALVSWTTQFPFEILAFDRMFARLCVSATLS